MVRIMARMLVNDWQPLTVMLARRVARSLGSSRAGRPFEQVYLHAEVQGVRFSSGVLTHLDPLPLEPQRVLVTGTSGAGKSTLARTLAVSLHLPYTEMDALFHGPNWTPRPEFLADVTALVQQPAWVTEWQYHQVRSLLADNAQVLVWLDYPRSLIMWRVIKRTVWRWATREELWNGNRERNLWRSFTEREGIVRWAWDTHPKTEERVRALQASGLDLIIVRLRSPRQAEVWLERLADGRSTN